MFNRFKSAVVSVVNSIEDTFVPNDKAEDLSPPNKLPLKFPYSRPSFLLLQGDDEIQATGDHSVRPIIVPRDASQLPWCAGYAEAVNAGKSLRNEDQASYHYGLITPSKAAPDPSSTGQYLPYHYFALFDGHAGSGAAVVASNQLIQLIHGKLQDVAHHLLPVPDSQSIGNSAGNYFWIPDKTIDVDSLIVGALEAAFHDMDQIIETDRKKYCITGGCTVLVAVFILGRLFIANAGDSRAVLCRNLKSYPLSNDFTPETERQRVRQLAALHPELLGSEFTATDFWRRPLRKDLGTKMPCREPYMTGWIYRTVTENDLKCPVVYGEGKRSRVLGTIGVTRGFGDHDLKALSTSVRVKPFLSSQPEVRIVNLEKEALLPTDVLVMGTDGLWDVTSNATAAEVVTKSLQHFAESDSARYKHRFTSAAQDLVMSSRGKVVERSWRTDDRPATIDDISVFVIPLLPYKEQHLAWAQHYTLTSAAPNGDKAKGEEQLAPAAAEEAVEVETPPVVQVVHIPEEAVAAAEEAAEIPNGAVVLEGAESDSVQVD